MTVLALLFFGVATIYSAVGFGGGSSYIALLSAAGMPYVDIPKVGLLCNLIVSMGAAWHFWRLGVVRINTLFPLLLGSVPCAFVGGAIPVSKAVFLSILGVTLCFAGGKLIYQTRGLVRSTKKQSSHATRLGAGAAIGLVSGITGIGGGIFLSPLLLNLGWAAAKESAGLAAVFICLNSAAGLGGQVLKGGMKIDFLSYGSLFLAVLIGGQLGARLGVRSKFSPQLMIRITGFLVLLVGVKSAVDGIIAITAKFYP